MTQHIFHWIRQPRVINGVQIVAYMVASVAGLLAALGGIPAIVTGTIGPIMAVAVGAMLFLGGYLGVQSVVCGAWWLERIALWTTGVGYGILLFATLWFALFGGRSITATIWLIVILEVQAICANIVRYRRIDWAYLDPTR